MTDPDLEELFVPEEARADLDLETPLPRTVVLLLAALGVGACLLMVLGGGRLLTWVGAVVYVAFLVLFERISVRSVDRQSDRIDAALAGVDSARGARRDS